jgi:hypothetical protein
MTTTTEAPPEAEMAAPKRAAAAKGQAAQKTGRAAPKPQAGPPDDDVEPAEIDPIFADDVIVIEEVRNFEAQADHLAGQAEGYRAEAAKRIVALLQRPGATERLVARAIGKSPAHVHHVRAAWQLQQENEDDKLTFTEAYNIAKAKKPPKELADSGDGWEKEGDPEPQPERDAGTDTAARNAERSSPGWGRQVRNLKELIDEMIDGAASVRETVQMSNLLEKGINGVISKQKELAATRDGG